MKEQFLKDVADTIKITIYNQNIALVPTSGTVTLYNPYGTVIQTAVAVTVNSTTGEMSYSLTATHTATSGLNFKAVWAYVISGVTYYETQLFDVVKSKLSIPIIDDDLYNELGSLRKAAYQTSGTATAGAAGSLTDTSRKEADSFWKGGKIKIIAGTGIGQERDITSFTQSTGVFEVSPNWGTNPSTDSDYIVIKSYNNVIMAAFEKLCTMLYNKGKRHNLILESSQISMPLIYLTIHMIAMDLMDEINDKWDRIQALYWEKFNQSFNTMALDYDEDDSGTIIGADEEQQNTSSLRVNRA